MWGIFPDCSPPYSLRQGIFANPEPSNSVGLVADLLWDSLSLLLKCPITGRLPLSLALCV